MRDFNKISNKLIAAENSYIFNNNGNAYYKTLNQLGALPKQDTQIENVMYFDGINYAGRTFEASTKIRLDDNDITLNMIGVSVEFKDFSVPQIEIKPLSLLDNFPSKPNVWRVTNPNLGSFINSNFALFRGVRTDIDLVLNAFLGKEGIGKFIWRKDFCMAVSVENTIVLFRKGRVQPSQNFYNLMREDIDYLANIFSESTDTAGNSPIKGKK